MIRRASVCVAVVSLAASAWAQTPREPLSARDIARPVTVTPGGEVILRGAFRSSHDGTLFDAATARAASAGVEGSGPVQDGGFYDLAAGGWRVVSRDPHAHAYRLAWDGRPAPACVAAHMTSPCLVSRVLPLAQSRLLPVGDFVGTLSGAITLEVVDPDTTPPVVPPPPGFVERWGAAMVGALVALALAATAAQALWRRSRTPVAAVRRAAARLRSRLRAGDPVHRRLLPQVDAMVAHADELDALAARLRRRVAEADRVALVSRRDALPREGDGGTARGLLDEQIARVDRWSVEAERAASRLERIRATLEATALRVDDASDGAVRDEASTVDALRALDEETRISLEAAREADALSPRGS